MKKRFLVGMPMGIIMFILIAVIACSKDEFSKDHNTLKIHNRTGSLTADDFITGYATRKLRSATITDHETGQTETMYDCTKPGKSCDVGEKPKKPNSFFIGFNPSTTTLTDHILSADSADIIFTAFFTEPVYSALLDGEAVLEHEDGYLVCKDTSTWTPLYAYQVEGPSLLKGTTEYRKGKVNTETKIFECLETGSNCAVKADVTSGKTTIIAFLEDAFPGITNLYDLIENHNYNIKSDENNSLVLIPAYGSGLDTLYAIP